MTTLRFIGDANDIFDAGSFMPTLYFINDFNDVYQMGIGDEDPVPSTESRTLQILHYLVINRMTKITSKVLAIKLAKRFDINVPYYDAVDGMRLGIIGSIDSIGLTDTATIHYKGITYAPSDLKPSTLVDGVVSGIWKDVKYYTLD